MKLSNQRLVPLYLTLTALFVRLVLLVALHPGDETVAYYEDVSIANHLLQGNGYSLDYSAVQVTNELFGAPPGLTWQPVQPRPSALKTPVYPTFVALVFWLFGRNSFFALFVVHALLASVTCLLLFLGLRRVSTRLAVLSAMGFALYPPFAYHSIAVPESTTLFLALLALFLWQTTRYVSERSWQALMVLGILGGLMGLIEAVSLPFAVVSILYATFVAHRGLAKTAQHLAVAWILLGLTLVPWVLRNQAVFGEFPMLRSGVGVNLLFSLRSAHMLPDDVVLSIATRSQGTNEIGEDQVVRETLSSWIRSNPAAYLHTVRKNFFNFWWETDDYQGVRELKYLLGRSVPYRLLLFLGLPAMFASLARILRRPRDSLGRFDVHITAWLLILSYTTVYTLFGAHNVRYHFPVELMLLPFAVESLLHLAQRARRFLGWSG